MKENRRGFTLIEMLLVVAIVGILSALILPVLQDAVQKAKQRGTMSEINTLGKAILTYASDTGYAPSSPDGPIVPGQPFLSDLDGLHIANVPLTDQWNRPLRVWTRDSVAGQFGIPATLVGKDDFLIQSLGRDGMDEGFTYNASNPQDLYSLVSSADFNKDLICWSGGWIRAPHAIQART
jgi:general secretion pathway protein G